MNRARLSLLCGLALTGGLFAQTATVPDDGLRISRDDPNGHPHDYTVSWERRLERTYFLQISEDLVTWFYFPDVIEHGVAGPVAHVISGLDTDRLYFRLLHTDEPYDVDFDHDKVSNLVETVLGTDPFAFADWDGDGMSDDWEFRYGLKPHDPLDANDNPDGDALTNLEEYHNGPEGTDPHNYFNAGTPVLRAVGGTEQAGEPGAFSPQPLVLEVRIGASPLEDCPIVVSTGNASAGQISLTNTGANLETILHLHTGGDGRVTVYFKHPTPPPAGGDAGRILQAQIEVPVPSTSYPLQGYQFTTKVNFTYPPGTVGLSAIEAIDNRLATINTNDQTAVDNAKRVFSIQVHTPPPPAQPNYVRNTSSWCYDLRQQMTCISPYNSLGAHTRAGTAITAQHIVTAKHFHLVNDDTIRFITANAGANNSELVVSRTIVGSVDHPTRDVTIHTLSSPLPTSITPCQVLPANYPAYLSYLGGGRPPVMYLDQEEKALVKELRAFDTDARFVKPIFHPNRLPFYEDAIGNDSGNPVFLIINGTLVLLSTARDYGSGDGTFLTDLVSPTLNEMISAADANATVHTMTTVNTGLQVQTVDLSGFSLFTPP